MYLNIIFKQNNKHTVTKISVPLSTRETPSKLIANPSIINILNPLSPPPPPNNLNNLPATTLFVQKSLLPRRKVESGRHLSLRLANNEMTG